MSHTPGPWKQFDGCGSDIRKPIIVDSTPDVDGHCVANCICYVATTNNEFSANARLIAAAPELLQACKLVEMWILGQQPAPHSDALLLEVIRTAIAKAEGAPS